MAGRPEFDLAEHLKAHEFSLNIVFDHDLKWCNYFTTIIAMPTMHKENDWAIRVNGDEPHPLPHVHVGFRDGSRVSVCIETGRVLIGSVRPPARLVMALDWIATHRDELFNEYRRLNP